MTEDILLTRSLSKELGLDQNEEKKGVIDRAKDARVHNNE